MKLSISNIAWRPEENDEISGMLVELGINGIELAPTLAFDNPAKAEDAKIKEYKAYWNKKGIDIVAFQALLFGKPELKIFDTSQSRLETFNYLAKIIELGSKLGAGVLVFGSPKNRTAGKIEKTEVMDIAIQFFSEIGEVARKFQLKFCIEPNSPEYGCDFITNTKEAVDLVGRVNSPGFGLHLDAGVMTLNGENYEESLDIAFEYLEHFHISEPFLNRITEAKTDHSRIARHLKKLCYDRWLSIEMRSNPPDESNIKMVEESLNYAIDTYAFRQRRRSHSYNN